jgi:hypothetical protein
MGGSDNQDHLWTRPSPAQTSNFGARSTWSRRRATSRRAARTTHARTCSKAGPRTRHRRSAALPRSTVEVPERDGGRREERDPLRRRCSPRLRRQDGDGRPAQHRPDALNPSGRRGDGPPPGAPVRLRVRAGTRRRRRRAPASTARLCCGCGTRSGCPTSCATGSACRSRCPRRSNSASRCACRPLRRSGCASPSSSAGASKRTSGALAKRVKLRKLAIKRLRHQRRVVLKVRLRATSTKGKSQTVARNVAPVRTLSKTRR